MAKAIKFQPKKRSNKVRFPKVVKATPIYVKKTKEFLEIEQEIKNISEVEKEIFSEEKDEELIRPASIDD